MWACGPVGPVCALFVFFAPLARVHGRGLYLDYLTRNHGGTVVVAVIRPREIAVVTIRYSSTGRPRRK